jgi:small subunit ribosomal protein S2
LADPITVKQLLEAGAHFGHQTGNWHPRMKNYIFTQRNGIHIIDLEKTVVLLEKACKYVRDLVSENKNILFVGTKKQAQDVIAEEAKRCGMFYVNQRWLGGMLTNFATIQSRIDFLVRLEDKKERGELDYLTKKEKTKVEKQVARLNKQVGGFKEMISLPGALFVIDTNKERIALSEAKKVGIPIVAVVDTDCSPDIIDYPIPANDDAIKAIKLVCSKIADAVLEGKVVKESSEAESTTETAPAEGTQEEPVTSYSYSPESGA